MGRAALVVLLGGATAALLRCSPAPAQADRTAPATGGAPGPRVVRTVAPVPVVEGNGFPSHLYVERDVSITARGSGLIEQVLVERGQRVKRGQALAVLESDLAAAELRMAEQELRYREAEFARASTLHDERIVSSEERLRKEIERDMTATEVELARTRLDHSTIRAPFDGTIVERSAVVGQRVVADDGVEMFRIVAADPLRARAYVPEAMLAGITRGGQAVVEPADGGAPVSARVVFVGPLIDAASGTAPVIVELGTRLGLRVGAAVTIQFDDAPSVGLFRLPRETVRSGAPAVGDAATVLVASGGTAVPRRVEVVDIVGADVVVRGGVTESDRVIFAPEEDLSPGHAVEPREERPR